MSTHLNPSEPSPARQKHIALWLAYFGFWIAIGLFLAIAELQHYLRSGEEHPWEPFLWELSSTLSGSLLVLLVYRWHRYLLATARALLLRIAAHLIGALVYALAHSVMMYSIRFTVYAFTDVQYEPGDALSIIAYEGAKDVVTYALMVALCHGALLFQRDRERREELVRLNAALAAAKLERLQEQIQPHFLFNTLNLVSSVMYEDVERADRILAQLADLLRQSLAAGQRLTHSLRDEMRLIEPFLFIMQQRFGPRLSVRIDIDKTAGECEIPSLLLLAPVENAIKHGVARVSGAIEIRIGAQVREGTLELLVGDSAGQLQADSRDDGIGLANTRARLAALYGEAARVTLAMEDADTVLRISLPGKVAA
jgi:two-component system, LytTR family, sensor kinase